MYVLTSDCKLHSLQNAIAQQALSQLPAVFSEQSISKFNLLNDPIMTNVTMLRSLR